MLTKVSAESKLLEFQNRLAFSTCDELPKFCSPQSHFLLGVSPSLIEHTVAAIRGKDLLCCVYTVKSQT